MFSFYTLSTAMHTCSSFWNFYGVCWSNLTRFVKCVIAGSTSEWDERNHM